MDDGVASPSRYKPSVQSKCGNSRGSKRRGHARPKQWRRESGIHRPRNEQHRSVVAALHHLDGGGVRCKGEHEGLADTERSKKWKKGQRIAEDECEHNG